MSWSEEALYNKAKLYMQTAAIADADTPLFPFWSSLSLELLCRSALAKVHPVLVADPRDVDNLLYACGHTIGKSPKSVGTAEVLQRCLKFVPRFDQQMHDYASKMMESRNAELHSGEAVFASFSSGSWQADHYLLAQVVLDHLGRSMEDYLGKDLAARAAQMLDKRSSETQKLVLQKISSSKKWFEQLSPETQAERSAQSETKLKDLFLRQPLIRECQCPACGSKAAIGGQITDRGEPKIFDGEIVVEARVLPMSFRCLVCELRLIGYAELNLAKLGDMYSTKETEDPVDFFSIDPMDYVDMSDLMIPDESGYRSEYDDE